MLNRPFPPLLTRIQNEATVHGDAILKIDHFLNHRIEPAFMQAMAAELALRLRALQPELILTAEASGIAPALLVARELGLPMVFGKKHRPELETPMLSRVLQSATRGDRYRMVLDQRYLPAGGRVAIVDDFLSHGRTASALTEMAREAGMDVVCAAFLVEKCFEEGHALLELAGVPVLTLAQVESLQGGKAILRR